MIDLNHSISARRPKSSVSVAKLNFWQPHPHVCYILNMVFGKWKTGFLMAFIYVLDRRITEIIIVHMHLILWNFGERLGCFSVCLSFGRFKAVK